MKVWGTQYTARYWVHPVQCRGHIKQNDEDVAEDQARCNMAYGVVTWYVVGPAFLIGTNDAHVVAMNEYAAVMIIRISMASSKAMDSAQPMSLPSFFQPGRRDQVYQSFPKM